MARRLLVGTMVAMLVGSVLGGCADQQTRERDTRLVRIRTELGAGFLERGQLALAQEEVKKALAIDSDNSEANNVMALIEARMRHYRKAERYFRRAISENPQNAGAENNYGVYLCQRGHVRRAVAHFQKAIDNPLYPSVQWANVNAGNCLLKRNQTVQAREYFKQALKAQPNLGIALYQLAKIDMDSGHPHRAHAYLAQYFAAAGESPQSLFLAVRVEQALGNLDKQATYALRLTSKYPDSEQAKELQRLGTHGEL